MSAVDALVAQLQAQRLQWVDVAPGVRMRIDTPSQFRAARIAMGLRARDGDAVVAELVPLMREWEGITGAFLLGPAVGSADPVPFDARLLAMLCADRPEWVGKLGAAALDQAAAARAQIETASGN